MKTRSTQRRAPGPGSDISSLRDTHTEGARRRPAKAEEPKCGWGQPLPPAPPLHWLTTPCSAGNHSGHLRGAERSSSSLAGELPGPSMV